MNSEAVWRHRCSTAGLALLLMMTSMGGQCDCRRPDCTHLVTSVADWQVQDYHDSRGIRDVRFQDDRLVLDAQLVGQDSSQSSGEVYLDLRYFPQLFYRGTVDLSHATIITEVDIPAGFIGWESSPNGVQFFAKDDNWRAQYGTWHNCTGRGDFEFEWSTYDIAHQDSGFNPSRVMIVGIKFGIGSNSSHKYEGPLYVNCCEICPELDTVEQPDLPCSTAPPAWMPGSDISLKGDGFFLDGTKWFVVGANWRILEYGQNFGSTAWFPAGSGVSKHTGFVRAWLDYARRSGIKLLRVNLLCDGRAMLDKDGHITGYDSIFRRDVRTLLDLAEEARVLVEFTLVDYLVAGKAEEVSGVWLRGREEIITDGAFRQEFLDRFLDVFLAEFGDHAALWGFDVINELEWLVSSEEGGGWEDASPTTRPEHPVPFSDLQAFVAACSSRIHVGAPGRFVTVGVSCKFSALAESLACDYRGFHYYDYMGHLGEVLEGLPDDKPWSLEEFPTANTRYTVPQFLDSTLHQGGSGALLWNLSPGIDDATYPWHKRNGLLRELRDWVDKHFGE